MVFAVKLQIECKLDLFSSKSCQIIKVSYWSWPSFCTSRVNTQPWYQVFVNLLRPRRNGRYNADDIFKCICLKENVWIPTKISLKFVPKGPINNIPALVQIMAWRRLGDKPLFEPMMVCLLMHICFTRPQWVKYCQGWVSMPLYFYAQIWRL